MISSECLSFAKQLTVFVPGPSADMPPASSGWPRPPPDCVSAIAVLEGLLDGVQLDGIPGLEGTTIVEDWRKDVVGEDILQ
jgi:hypothetical protein